MHILVFKQKYTHMPNLHGPIRLLTDHDFTVRCIQVNMQPLDGTLSFLHAMIVLLW